MRRTLFLVLTLLLLVLTLLFLVVATLTRQEVAPSLKFSPDQLLGAQIGQFYSATITVSNNATPVGQMSIVDGALPHGLVLHHTRASSTAEISGIPDEAGDFKFAVSVWCFGTSVSGQTGQRGYELVVKRDKE